jgi:hypothetical protein
LLNSPTNVKRRHADIRSHATRVNLDIRHAVDRDEHGSSVLRIGHRVHAGSTPNQLQRRSDNPHHQGRVHPTSVVARYADRTGKGLRHAGVQGAHSKFITAGNASSCDAKANHRKESPAATRQTELGSNNIEHSSTGAIDSGSVQAVHPPITVNTDAHTAACVAINNNPGHALCSRARHRWAQNDDTVV